MEIVLQLLVLQPGVVRQDADAPSLKALLLDPYIIVSAGRNNEFSKTLSQGEKLMNFFYFTKRCYYICKYGNCNAGTLAPNLDDGHDECT